MSLAILSSAKELVLFQDCILETINYSEKGDGHWIRRPAFSPKFYTDQFGVFLSNSLQQHLPNTYNELGSVLKVQNIKINDCSLTYRNTNKDKM